MQTPTWILPQNPESALDIPCALSSRSTSTLSSPVVRPNAGILMGTCRIPKKVSESIAGTVARTASQLTAVKSGQSQQREISSNGSGQTVE